jgi:hypothetical protein
MFAAKNGPARGQLRNMQPHFSVARRGLVPTALLASTALLTGGCTSIKMTGTPRSGTEQLLLTGTWDTALWHIDFRPLAGKRVFVDPQHISVVDKEWVISSIRRTIAEQGALIENNKDKAELILEGAFGAYGTDERTSKTGLPPVGVLPSIGGISVASAGTSSALTFGETNRQDAVVKAALFAYEAKTGRIVWESGPMLNAEGVRDHFFFSSGPYRLSSMPEVEGYPSEAQTQTRKRLWQRLFPIGGQSKPPARQEEAVELPAHAAPSQQSPVGSPGATPQGSTPLK